MGKLILPLILALVGIGAGAGAGWVLKPAPEMADVAVGETPEGAAEEETDKGHVRSCQCRRV